MSLNISFFATEKENIVNLIIEQGNTLTKVAVYAGGQLVESLISHDLEVWILAPLFDKYSLTKGIFSTVTSVNTEVLDFLKGKLVFFLYFDEHTLLPVTVEYVSKKTLGRDRLAAVVGANYLKPGNNILVIDAGTAITYELVTSGGVYKGGNISPGLTTRFEALNRATGRLPLVTEEGELPEIGKDTVTAIRAGVVRGIIYEMDGYINDLHRVYPDLLIFLTGGHSIYFERRLKNSIFADINLVLMGLNRILEYNVENK